MRAALRGLTRTGSGPGRPRRIAGAVVGAILLAAAVWVVLSQRSVLASAADALRHARPELVLAIFALPLVSWLTTSATFWLLSNRYASVPFADMVRLIGAAWLLNHLPFRPGMVGRIAFHRKYHGMPIADAVRVMIAAMILTAISLAMLLAVAVAISGVRDPVLQAALLTLPTALVLALAAAARAARRAWWREVAALGARSLDMLSWVARYAIVFMLVGAPLSIERVIAITAVCQVAMIVPLTGNGLGLREWVVGLTLAAVALPGAREQAAAIGLAADLLNRAAETLLAVPVGLACAALLARSVRRRTPAAD